MKIIGNNRHKKELAAIARDEDESVDDNFAFVSTTEDEDISSTEEIAVIAANTMMALPGKKNVKLHDCDAVLDSAATVGVFHNARLLTNLRHATRPVRVGGLNKNGEAILADKVGEILDLSTVYHHPDVVANILCFANVKDKASSVEYVNDSFIVQSKGKAICFSPVGKFYVYNPMLRGSDQQEANVMVQTVAANEENYTKRQIAMAQLARSLQRKLAYASVRDIAMMVGKGMILNVPVTVSDLHRAENLYGPDLGELKGKTTRRRAQEVIIERPVEIADMDKSDIVLCIYIFCLRCAIPSEY